MGTIVNVLAVLFGGTVGILLKKKIRDSFTGSMMKAQGVALFVIALNGLLSSMLSVGEDGRIESNGGLLLLLSFVIGNFLGEWLRLDDRVNGLGEQLEKKIGVGGFSKGFIAASLIFCIGSMSVMGPLEEGISGIHDLLFVKSVLDGVTALVLSSTLGWGVLAAAVPVLVYQGAITLFAQSLSPLLTNGGNLVNDFSMVGYGIILCIAFNFVTDSKIKTANLLLALLVPIVYDLILLV